jgi:hypothetical protein
LPPGWRVTADIQDYPYEDEMLDRSNAKAILESLRALDAKEGEDVVVALTREKLHGKAMDADWYLYLGRIIWKCQISDEEYRRAKQEGAYHDRRSDSWGFEAVEQGYQLLALDLLGTSDFVHEEPVLDALLEINRDLAGYPVLDEDDFYEREREAECESIQSCLPQGCPPLTEKQVNKVHRFLETASWPPEDPNDMGCPAKYQVEWSGTDYHMQGSANLDDAVAFACRYLHIYPHWGRKKKR